MLSNRHFYHRLTRKYIQTFANLFNDIWLVRYDYTTSPATEIERRKVPIVFSPKEKWVTRQDADSRLARQTQMTLPRLAVEFTGLRYVNEKKKQTMVRNVKANTATQLAAAYMEVPYDLSFSLSAYSRNIDDAYQIMEQILPYFTPDYTVSGVYVPELGITQDIAVILNNISEQTTYEGDADSIREVVQQYDFTLKGEYYGPVTSTGVIKHAITNIYNHPELRAGYVTKVNVNAGNNGDYPIGSWVFQGNSQPTAFSAAKVIKWDKTNQILYLGGTQGDMKANQWIRSVETNASYNLLNFDANPILLSNISISPDPADASPNTNYGYNIVITEFPDTLG